MPERPAPKGGAAEGDAPPRLSRREMLEKEERPIEMPPIEWGMYLVDYLFEFGPVRDGGMSAARLMPDAIAPIERVLGIQFHPWQARLLLRLSMEYWSEANKATEQDCPAPWQPETYQPEKILAAIEQRNAFRRLAKL